MQIHDILTDREIIIVNKLDKYTSPLPPPFPISSLLEHIRDLSNRDSVKIIPFRFDDFSRWRLMSAVIKACNGKTPDKSQEITLRFGKYGTIDELFPDVDKLSSMEITSRLQCQFTEWFGEIF